MQIWVGREVHAMVKREADKKGRSVRKTVERFISGSLGYVDEEGEPSVEKLKKDYEDGLMEEDLIDA
jgi:hypothetical protein